MKNRNDLVNAVAEKTGKTKKEVAEVLGAIEEEMKAIVTEKDAIRLAGFLEVGYKFKDSRRVHNPKTGESMMSQPKDSQYARFFGDWHNTTR